MSDIILHHYALSPYSEKIRAALGWKQLAWQSVEQPAMMPKSDQVALTGGYRRAPVLQIGRDIYCDSRLIVRVLDRLKPNPALVPAGLKASCAAFGSLEPALFFAAIPVVLQPAGLKFLQERMGPDFLALFFKDRAALFNGGTVTGLDAEFSRLNFLPLMSGLDAQLVDRSFLLGEAPTLADFIAWNPVSFVLANPGISAVLDPFRNLLAWVTRIRGFGHGMRSELSPATAIEIARTTNVTQPFDGPVLEPEGIKIGQQVTVNATDYGCDPVAGTLAHASVFELALRRSDSRAGELLVHFPRSGFKVAAA